jgi:hypothetical protein
MNVRRVLLAVLLLVTGCNKAADIEKHDTTVDVVAGPQVGVAAAPGMSLSYAYGFRLPVERISGAQEENASQCEAMGPATCRITGMSYEVARDRTVSAALLLKLAPQAARQFGKQAVAAVVSHGGMLTSTHIESEDSGAVVAAAQDEKAALDAERTRIEKQLAVPGLGSAERQGLEAQLANLAGETSEKQAAQRDATLKLASTPMTLLYETGEVDQTLSEGPIIGAVKDGWANIISGVALIVMILITLVPWAVCIVVAGWLWQRFWRNRKPPEYVDAEAET